jgi:hypothetical protein
MRRIDDVCAAWAAIVAERMAADQQFTDLYEAYRTRSADLRGLFAWDALHAAEAHLALVNSALARHIGDDGRADPRAILADLRWEQRKLAAVYSVNAFLAVLNQMSPHKAKWANLEEFDPRIAVLSLAHQTLGYALECLRLADPGDPHGEDPLCVAAGERVGLPLRGLGRGVAPARRVLGRRVVLPQHRRHGAHDRRGDLRALPHAREVPRLTRLTAADTARRS